MGSSSSKSDAAESSTSGHGRSHSRRSKVFQSSCIGPPSGSPDSDNDNDEQQVSGHQAKENGTEVQCAEEAKSNSGHGKAECDKKVKVKQPGEMTCVSSNMQPDTVSRGDSSSSRAFFFRSLNTSSRFLSRFSFFPDNVNFRLSRTTSLGPSRAYSESSTSFTISNHEELHLHRNKTPQGCEFFPACLINRSPRPQHEDFASSNLGLNPSASGVSDNLQDCQMAYTQNVASDTDSNTETRLVDRRIEAREPVERNVQFSRTLSVGRLRDRVLRRSLFPDLISCPSRQEREVVDTSEGSRSQALGGGTEVEASNENALISPTSPPIMSSSLYGSQDFEVETTRARYHDLLEHTSTSHERRRRIRSQVRTLQRMGSRFENLSGHERSCILSGQHRTGHCTCRLNSRDGNSNNGTSARASISRIVLLAEALFEVLDEIHQQSVVLSSRLSLSSIGSVPAPNEVVESLPVKLYHKFPRHLNEEDAQCYICLVEYEEGDAVRVLPCHHEFHRSCIDKWLKEIHRICPLCRGDICRSDSLPAEN